MYLAVRVFLAPLNWYYSFYQDLTLLSPSFNILGRVGRGSWGVIDCVDNLFTLSSQHFDQILAWTVTGCLESSSQMLAVLREGGIKNWINIMLMFHA